MTKSNSILCTVIAFILVTIIINPSTVQAQNYYIKEWKYAVGECDQDYQRAIQLSYKPLERTNDLHLLISGKKGFIWLRHDFDLSYDITQSPVLALLIERIMIADQTYLNGVLIGSTGNFPPNFFSGWNKVRLYTIPKVLLKHNANNTILIKIYVNGEGSISGKVIIGAYSQLEHEYDYLDFINSRFNAIISFLFFLVGWYYILMFILRKKDKENMYFGLTCLAFSLYLFNFFITRLPGFTYESIPYLLFQKIIFILIFIIAYFLTNFLMKYLEISESKIINIILLISMIVPSLMFLIPNTYQTFLSIRYRLLLIFLPIFALYGIIITIISLKKRKREAYILIIGSIPFYFCIFWDLIVHNLLKIDDAIYLMGYGFPSFLISLAGILAIQTVQYHNEVEELNVTLEKKVEERTRQLYEANQELKLALEQITEHQRIAEKDMFMAVNVQKSIVPQKAPGVNNYDIGLYAKAMSGVSGDFCDFYIENDLLIGAGLFDVSGHGIASGLLTIVSKSIICRNFMNYRDAHLGRVMEYINQELMLELENVDNYLTGILLRFKDERVEYVNAAHTELLLKRYNSDTVITCTHREKEIKGMFLGKSLLQSNYLPLQFTLKTGDMLLLYSDCLIEQKNNDAEEFGFERVKDAFRTAVGNSAQEVCNSIVESFNQFKGSVDLADDLTIIVIKKL